MCTGGLHLVGCGYTEETWRRALEAVHRVCVGARGTMGWQEKPPASYNVLPLWWGLNAPVGGEAGGGSGVWPRHGCPVGLAIRQVTQGCWLPPFLVGGQPLRQVAWPSDPHQRAAADLGVLPALGATERQRCWGVRAGGGRCGRWGNQGAWGRKLPNRLAGESPPLIPTARTSPGWGDPLGSPEDG